MKNYNKQTQNTVVVILDIYFYFFIDITNKQTKNSFTIQKM